jgi:hypothetical protein
MWFSASLEKRDGTRFVPEQILGAVQECAKAYFIERGEIYQVFAKIEMPDGTIERLPVWIVQGQAVASDGYPANAVKAQKYETLTIVFTDMPDINAPDAAMHIKHIRRLLLSYVAELKRKRGWRKEGLEKLPPNYVNGGSGKAGPDVGGIKIYDPKGRLDGGVVRDRGWRGAEAGVAPPSTIGGRSSVPDEEGLRRAKGAKYSLKKARRELRYSKKK